MMDNGAWFGMGEGSIETTKPNCTGIMIGADIGPKLGNGNLPSVLDWPLKRLPRRNESLDQTSSWP